MNQKRSVKTVFTSSSDSTLNDPLCICMICRESARPIPDPVFLVVKKGTKIRWMASGMIPGPLSVT